MTKTFTHNEMIQYLYDELSEEDRKEFENYLICNSDDLDMFSDLRVLKQKLNKLIKTPPKRAIEKILNYSKSFNLHSINE